MLTPLRQPGLVSIRSLIPSASFVGCADISVSAVTEHSQDCTPGCLFAALPGTRTHGREHVKQALLGGAAAILSDRPLAEIALPQCIVPDARQVYGRLCHGLYAFPSQRLGVAGVTGTNGKTTTTWILRSLLQSASRPTGVIGTIEYTDGFQSQPSSLTTPDPLTMARVLAAMRDRQTTHAAMELSSHALKQGRAAGLLLDVGIVTNITQDHLDYHESFDDYLNSKARISTLLKPGGVLVLNADDPHCRTLRERVHSQTDVWTFGIENEADVTASDIHLSPEGTRFRLHFRAGSIECRTSLTGLHNISNCLAAASAALHFGLSLEQIANGFEKTADVPGRLEKVNCGQPFQVYVDYAHTDDALRRVIASVRAVTKGRVILVFGAGGDRDRSKRPLMARAACAADHVILTSDNPRSEDPLQIIHEILAGFAGSAIVPAVEVNREYAIHQAIESAQPGDAVIIAGKGHEKVQILGDRRIRFDDVEVCQEALRARPHILQGMHVHPEIVPV
jgi:UDP-N-acetylmuramyl-tripeptide synthetase